MKKELKWTHQIRTLTFSRLAVELGRDYRRNTLLHRENREREKVTVAELATHLTQMTGKPFRSTEVMQQVNWALNEPQSFKQSHVTVYAKCKVAAHEVGLIGRIVSHPVVLGT